MPNGMYGGVRGRKMKQEENCFIFLLLDYPSFAPLGFQSPAFGLPLLVRHPHAWESFSRASCFAYQSFLFSDN